MDPNPQDLTSILSVEDAKNWVGIPPELWTGFTEVTGPLPLVRDIAMITATEWANAIDATVITSVGTAGSDGTPTTTSLAIRVSEKGRLRGLRRVARLMFGLDPSELPTPALANSALGAVAANGPDPCRTEVAAVLDQTTKSRIIPLPKRAVSKMFDEYKLLYGAYPDRESEPTYDLICAMDTVLKELRPPYGDLAIIRPHGRDWQRKLTFMGTILGSSGEIVRKELSGPPSFKEWWRSWKVYKALLLLLKVATSAALDAYAEHIRELSEEAPWDLVYAADVLMRLEEFECIRRDLEERRGKLSTIAVSIADALVPFDATMPWNSVFLYSTSSPEGRAFWVKHVTNQVLFVTTHASSRQVTTAERPQPKNERAPHTSPPPGDREVPWMKKPRVESSTPACTKYNSADGCTTNEADCPHSLGHYCAFCKIPGHATIACYSAHPELRKAGSFQQQGKGGNKQRGTAK
jgi:hypothetical protein